MNRRIRCQITLLPETFAVATILATECGLSRSHFIECAIVNLAQVMTAMKADQRPPFQETK